MEISVNLKERFCKDCNIPINIFQEPYFMERMKLYDQLYGTLDKWNVFIKELERYKTEQDYFEEYNRIKDSAINDIKATEAYQRFNNENMNKYAIKYKDFPSKDIYHPSNIGRRFISIDMRKANFSSLKYYDSNIFAGTETWEEFMSKYTENKHIINSKYIRQVILGNCNCKRHITYEKYLMETILEMVLPYISKDLVVFFSNDEIIIDITDFSGDKEKLEFYLKEVTRKTAIPLKVEVFTLYKIDKINGYYKDFGNNNFELKCTNSLYLPFVIRYFNGEDIAENDKVFYRDGLLAKFIETPEIKILKN